MNSNQFAANSNSGQICGTRPSRLLLADAAIAGLKKEIGELKTQVALLKGELDVAKATKAKEIAEAVFTESTSACRDWSTTRSTRATPSASRPSRRPRS